MTGGGEGQGSLAATAAFPLLITLLRAGVRSCDPFVAGNTRPVLWPTLACAAVAAYGAVVAGEIFVLPREAALAGSVRAAGVGAQLGFAFGFLDNVVCFIRNWRLRRQLSRLLVALSADFGAESEEPESSESGESTGAVQILAGGGLMSEGRNSTRIPFVPFNGLGRRLRGDGGDVGALQT